MPGVGTLPSSWLSEDSQLKELLKKIHHRFAELIRHDYIAESHLNRLSRFTVNELQCTSSTSLFQNYGLDLLPTCMCFSGAAQLQKVLKFLEEISHYCGLVTVSEKSCTDLEEVSSMYKGMAGGKVIVLSRDGSCLLLRGQLPSSESNPHADIVSWIFSDSSTWDMEALRS